MKREEFTPSFIVFIVLVLYLVLSQFVFAIRHPSMTSTERMLHLKDALLFKRLSE